MIYIYYSDDYHANGGVGFGEFTSMADAEKFINARLQASDNPNISNYTVIEGRKLDIEEVQVVREVRLFKS